MKTIFSKQLMLAIAFCGFVFNATAQDDDGIYGDIYQTSPVEEVMEDSVSPLDGYSTVDDYYPEGGYNRTAGDQRTTETYTDENGTVINNYYYGDYYEDNDYAYASRIRRFHNNNFGWGYYDPWYTNMYWYNYDPFFWGTSIYAGAWPSWGWGVGWNSWNCGFGWNNWGWNAGWGCNTWGWGAGWNSWGWGWNNWGWNNPYWNGYNQGYWNGFYDGLAVGGYYNTFDPYSGIYYGHRGSAGTGGTVGSGYRNTSFASVYNQAALEGKVHHANKGNVLGTTDGAPVVGNLDGYQIRTAAKGSGETRNAVANPARENVPTRSLENGQMDRSAANARTADRTNSYQRTQADRASTVREREVVRTSERARVATAPTRERTQTPSVRENTYYRGNAATRIDSRQAGRTVNPQNGNSYSVPQRSNPNMNNGYNRNPGSDYYRPQQSGPNGNERYQRPADDNRYSVPSRNYQAPSRGEQAPSRNYQAPSRNYQAPSRDSSPSRPSRNYEAPSRPSPSRSVSPNRGSSGGSYSSPSRSSGSFNSGGRGSMSSPSRSSGGSRSGRP